MRRVVFAFTVVVMFVSLFAAIAYADDGGTGFILQIKKDKFYDADSDFDFLALNPSLSYQVWYDGTASLSYGGTNGATATLTGVNDPDSADSRGVTTTNIWRYYYSTLSNVNTDEFDSSQWIMFDSLVGPLSCPANSQNNSQRLTGNTTISGAKYIAIAYDIELTKTASGTAIAGGTGTMTVNAVPEPGTICAALSVLAPVGFVFRRKRS